MRIRTRLAFLCLLAVGAFFVLQTNQVVLAEGCTAPGLIGFGDTSQEAISACHDYADTHCDGMCQSGCGMSSWTTSTCSSQGCSGGSCTAAGWCNCSNPM